MKTKTIKFDYKIILIISLLLFLALTTISSSNAATPLYVNGADGNDTWDGTTPTYTIGITGPMKTIQTAIDAVDNDGTVNVADGTYKEHLTINKNVNLVGESQEGTIIDGNNTGRPITINPDMKVTISKFTIKNGNSSGGGGITNNGDLTISEATIRDNTATEIEGYAYGGGIYNHGNLTITNSIILENTVIGGTAYGGGIYNDANLIVNHSTITGNIANSTDGYADGGGISNEYGIITINNSIISGNAATGDSVYGGGISHSFSSNLTINNSSITGNAATGDSVYGGGISNWGAIITINNTSITDNTATGNNVNGGGIYNNGDLIVNNSSITNNTATGDSVYGGGIYNYGDLTITETTLTDNNASDAEGSAYGGAINNNGILTANYNRIVNNSPNAIYFDTESGQSNVQYNWWGSNNPDFATLINGTVDYNPWLYLTITTNPSTINNGATSQITASFNNLFDGTTVTPLDPNTGHIPDGSPVTFNTDKGSIGSKTIDKETINGLATATLTADETAGIAHVNAVTDNQTVNTEVTINPKSSLYLTITPNKTNPVVGDTVIYTLKVGNNGPDTASNVVMTYVVPEGLEFAGANVDTGTYTYNPTTRTITWNIGDVPVGDPYMWLSLKILRSGSYLINPTLSTTTYDPTLNTDTQSITIHATAATNNNTQVKAVSMQHTGIPLIALILALFMVIGGMVSSKNK
ncbi:MAG: hypothetical protein CVV28_09920 [Methanobacteriales archaeon HGW-Methanobacteriales-1]|nr:MAG: hypothetical protein CVV28_09920 [Methanobacteriales archaeon HGW-Methanobacteriales-1]